MKKIFTVIFISLFSIFVFATNTINISLPTISVGALPHNIDDTTYSGIYSKTGISGEYLYIFNNGLSIGGNITLYPHCSYDDIVNEPVYMEKDSTGDGVSFSPVIGWSYKGNIALIQILAYPLIVDSATYSKHTIKVSKKESPEYEKEEKLISFKTGSQTTFEWGGKHFRAGFGAGLYFTIMDNYTDTFKSAFGVEFIMLPKITILF